MVVVCNRVPLQSLSEGADINYWLHKKQTDGIAPSDAIRFITTNLKNG